MTIRTTPYPYTTEGYNTIQDHKNQAANYYCKLFSSILTEQEMKSIDQNALFGLSAIGSTLSTLPEEKQKIGLSAIGSTLSTLPEEKQKIFILRLYTFSKLTCVDYHTNLLTYLNRTSHSLADGEVKSMRQAYNPEANSYKNLESVLSVLTPESQKTVISGLTTALHQHDLHKELHLLLEWFIGNKNHSHIHFMLSALPLEGKSAVISCDDKYGALNEAHSFDPLLALQMLSYIPIEQQPSAIESIGRKHRFNTRIARAFLGTLTEADKKELKEEGISQRLLEYQFSSADFDQISELYKAATSKEMDLLFSREPAKTLPSASYPKYTQTSMRNLDLNLPNELKNPFYAGILRDLKEGSGFNLNVFEQALMIRLGDKSLPSIKTTSSFKDKETLLNRIILQHIVRSSRPELTELEADQKELAALLKEQEAINKRIELLKSRIAKQQPQKEASSENRSHRDALEAGSRNYAPSV